MLVYGFVRKSKLRIHTHPNFSFSSEFEGELNPEIGSWGSYDYEPSYLPHLLKYQRSNWFN